MMQTTKLNGESVIVHNAPVIPGLSLRKFRGPQDYPLMLDLINAAKVVDKIERNDTLEDITRNYSHLVNSDPYQDMLFAEVDGQVAGYCRVEWSINAQGEWLGFHLSFVHPNWREQGIVAIFMNFCEDRLRSKAAELLEQGVLKPEQPRLFSTLVYDTEEAKEDLLNNSGYIPVRHEHLMLRADLENIPAAPLPEGLEVRPVLPEHYRLIWEANVEAFRDHWGFVQPEEEEYKNWLEDRNFDPSIWKVAWDGDQVAGMVQTFINHDENHEYGRLRGWTEGICVRRPWRRKGLARSLLVQSLHRIKERGMQEAALTVDTQNLSGAFRIYESVGFLPVRRQATFRKKF